MLTYMASCGSTTCDKFDDTQAQWFKISEDGKTPGDNSTWLQQRLSTSPPSSSPLYRTSLSYRSERRRGQFDHSHQPGAGQLPPAARDHRAAPRNVLGRRRVLPRLRADHRRRQPDGRAVRERPRQHPRRVLGQRPGHLRPERVHPRRTVRLPRSPDRELHHRIVVVVREWVYRVDDRRRFTHHHWRCSGVFCCIGQDVQDREALCEQRRGRHLRRAAAPPQPHHAQTR